LLFAPGDCFDAPAHFRLGFGAVGDGLAKALDRMEELMIAVEEGHEAPLRGAGGRG